MGKGSHPDTSVRIGRQEGSHSSDELRRRACEEGLKGNDEGGVIQKRTVNKYMGRCSFGLSACAPRGRHPRATMEMFRGVCVAQA